MEERSEALHNGARMIAIVVGTIAALVIVACASRTPNIGARNTVILTLNAPKPSSTVLPVEAPPVRRYYGITSA